MPPQQHLCPSTMVRVTLQVLACCALLPLAAAESAPEWLDSPTTTCNLEDCTCNLEEIDKANTAQLHDILHDLSETTFFRLIHVNMDGKCQYWGGPPAEDEDDELACESKAPDTAVPLCSVGSADDSPFGGEAPFGGPHGGASDGFSSPVDATITPEEEEVVAAAAPEDCSDEAQPSFWLDMCSNIPTNSSDYVNLLKNAESYTGYNGSHVWAAIYEENCLFRTGGSATNICLEERVLYRLLSGLHAATNTHVARFYHAPSKRQGRTEWAPDLRYFGRQFDGHPERLKNLHFAFVVLLRALRRASPFLATYDFPEPGVAGEAGDGRTAALMRRLLDTSILRSCASAPPARADPALSSPSARSGLLSTRVRARISLQVFDAFDEEMLFKESQAAQHRIP